MWRKGLRDGQPVGSRTLLEEAGLPVSAATIRHVLSDLEERGYLRFRKGGERHAFAPARRRSSSAIVS